jgi:hypothetical protein
LASLTYGDTEDVEDSIATAKRDTGIQHKHWIVSYDQRQMLLTCTGRRKGCDSLRKSRMCRTCEQGVPRPTDDQRSTEPTRNLWQMESAFLNDRRRRQYLGVEHVNDHEVSFLAKQERGEVVKRHLSG